MKAFTSLEQSKKLAEILPLESADMWYSIVDDESFVCLERHYEHEQIPCWSLAALLDVLESEINSEYGETYLLNITKDGIWWYVDYIEQYDESSYIETEPTEELIDACYEMILKLKELNLL